MRLFVGVPLPDDLRTAVSEYIERWRSRISGVKYVAPENLHITLKFIGEVNDARVPAIKGLLSDIRTGPFTINAHGVGAFPQPSSPRVVWVGIREGFDDLVNLSRSIDEILVSEGIPRERKAFHPHITIGRVKRYDPEITRLLVRDVDLDFGSFTFERFTLFRSTLTPDGPIYDVLAEYGVSK